MYCTLWDHMLDMTITSYQLSIPQRERDGAGKVAPIGWAHLYLSVNFHRIKGEGRAGS